ncbi:LpxI family protein [Roseomonas hellenica]|uniref:LpxI family protein n=1 Tax=Plastoroseomonas hellenica TaxID=2687306 RepID=A0ABS5F7L1_9PROT|nr:UDP-2,3-diacylglucosamine diphosphatase LpxI [Plastoroseomonas hellenica]MBR0668471.1 LpxI family protein [Plastoroseomonas hellenica]
MNDAASPLGILAGGGELPRRVARAAASAGRPVRVVVLNGFAATEDFAPHPAVAMRFGHAARMLDWLRAEGVRQVVMAGTVTRPSMLSLMPDAATLKLATRIGRAAFGGDDSILQAVIRVLGEEGFEVLGADRLLSGLTPKAGLLAGPEPDADAVADIARGFAVAGALGALDVGQAVVVQQGLVLGVEAIEGTDALLARVGPLRREGPGGVLVKRVKPGQSRLADLPTIGPRTVAGAAAAGLRGLAIEANGTIVMERAATVAAAEAAGLFLLALHADDVGGSER